MMLVPTIFEIALLSVIVALIAGDEAGWDMGHVFFLCLKIALVSILSGALLEPLIGGSADLIFGVVAFYILWQDLGTTIPKALAILIAWLACSTLAQLLFLRFVAGVFELI